MSEFLELRERQMSGIDESQLLKAKGARWWHSDDYASPNLTKKSLGEFFNAVLSSGAQVGNIWTFNPNFSRSGVYVTIFATEEMKQRIEASTRYRFHLPHKIALNGGN